ncbi:hypothetical protein ACJ51O_08065 [Burkholderia pyrrocinia]|uniref:hypothetical protein n=1 Tax=Burkholderia pyrrocinia TaxID=60550 RepID=UPI0038B63D5B
MTDKITDGYFEILESLGNTAREIGAKDSHILIRAIEIQTRILEFAQHTAQHEISKRLLSLEEQILELRKTLSELNGRQ